MMLTCDKPEIGLGDTLTLTARILNTTTEPVGGKIRIKGIPDDWRIELVEGLDSIYGLEFGEIHEVTFGVSVTSKPDYDSRITYTESSEMQHMDFAISPYVILDDDGTREDAKLDDVAHSLPTTVTLKTKTQE